MKSELLPTVQAITEFMPPKKNGIFEKSMEVARLLLEHEPVSIIAHTVDGAIQNYGMIKEMKYRAKALKYVTNLEEVRLNAQIEIARIQNSNMAVQMYIDKAFQQSVDCMEAAYLRNSYLIDHNTRRMIKEVNSAVTEHFNNIDRRYIDTVRENEMKCAMYRQFVNGSINDGVKKSDITFFIAKKLVDNMDRYNSNAVSGVCNVLAEMLRQEERLSFDEYLGLEKKLKRM
ncbi:MAG: hypothetical protein PHW34_13505 [Hespellia sp.]|nr:hypothetical protein [Hespellia sp.]